MSRSNTGGASTHFNFRAFFDEIDVLVLFFILDGSKVGLELIRLDADALRPPGRRLLLSFSLRVFICSCATIREVDACVHQL